MTSRRTAVAEAVLPAESCRSAQGEEFNPPSRTQAHESICLESIHMRRSNPEEYQKKSRLIDTAKVGRKDRGDVAKSDEAQSANRSWSAGAKGLFTFCRLSRLETQLMAREIVVYPLRFDFTRKMWTHVMRAHKEARTRRAGCTPRRDASASTQYRSAEKRRIGGGYAATPAPILVG